MTRIDAYRIIRSVVSALPETKTIPARVYGLPLNERIKWARQESGLSHDRVVARLGRSNRGHLLKIERGLHVPRQDLRDALADVLNVPRDLFADDPQEAAQQGGQFRGGGADARGPDGASRATGNRDGAPATPAAASVEGEAA